MPSIDESSVSTGYLYDQDVRLNYDQEVRLNTSRDQNVSSYDPIGELFDIAGGLSFLAEKFDNDNDLGPARLIALLASNVRGVAVHMDEAESRARYARQRKEGEKMRPDLPLSHNEFNDLLIAYCESPETWRKIASAYGAGGEKREKLELLIADEAEGKEPRPSAES